MNQTTKIQSPNFTTAKEAVKAIKSKQRVFISGNCATPIALVSELTKRIEEENLQELEIVHVLANGELPYANPKFEKNLRINNLFIGAPIRKAVQEGRADYTPIFLHEIPRLFNEGYLPLDVAIVNVSPPDTNGYCSFGVEVCCSLPAAKSAKIVIAQINDQMPYTYGDGLIHINDIDYCIETSNPIIEFPQSQPSEVFEKIGYHISTLIEDGSTLQMGIGSIPDAILPYLKNKKDLGIHTEMFSDNMIDLIDCGAINNQAKTIHQGKIIASFAMGTKKLYDFMDKNPDIEMLRVDYVNDPFVISQNNKMVAINSAIEVDLTGQVCSDSIGHLPYSGIGGQVDFIRGASRSKGGKAIIALTSTLKGDTISRIVPTLKPGAGVVTSRGDVHYVVTEHGIANLYGKSLRERAKALINIAHPKFRDQLSDAFKQSFLKQA